MMGGMPLPPPLKLTTELFDSVAAKLPVEVRGEFTARYTQKGLLALEDRSVELLQFLEENRARAGGGFPQKEFDELSQALQEYHYHQQQQQQMAQHMAAPPPGMYIPGAVPFIPQGPPGGAPWPPHGHGMPPAGMFNPMMPSPGFPAGFPAPEVGGAGYPPYHPPHMQQQYLPQPQQLPEQQQVAEEEGSGSDDDSDDLLNALLGSNDAAAGAEARAVEAGGRKGWSRVVANGQEDQQMDDASFPRLGAAAAAEDDEEEDEEGGDDRDLQRALQASLETANERPVRGAISSGEGAAGVVGGPEVGAAGLANETGEYNCFLNVVVQCLWNCMTFRKMLVKGCKETGQPVVRALVDLFEDLQEAQTGWQPGQAR
jgi:hypothetical protein